MSFLDKISPQERELLVSLPYRVGLFVSQSDTDGGETSDEHELRALSNILQGYAGEMFVCETVQYVISETVQSQDKWGAWRANLGDVKADCHKAIEILKAAVDPKEVSAFKQHIMEVGEAVALAFREVGELSFIENLKLKIKFKKQEYAAKKQGVVYKSYEEFLNISDAERAALEELADALRIKYAI